MDSDEEYSDFETEEWDDLDSSGVSVTKTPSFETLTTEDIVHLMNQYIEQVNAIVMVSWGATSVAIKFSTDNFVIWNLFPVANNYHTHPISDFKMGETRSIG